jgi:hypothetical protein
VVELDYIEQMFYCQGEDKSNYKGPLTDSRQAFPERLEISTQCLEKVLLLITLLSLRRALHLL